MDIASILTTEFPEVAWEFQNFGQNKVKLVLKEAYKHFGEVKPSEKLLFEIRSRIGSIPGVSYRRYCYRQLTFEFTFKSNTKNSNIETRSL